MMLHTSLLLVIIAALLPGSFGHKDCIDVLAETSFTGMCDIKWKDLRTILRRKSLFLFFY
jgi:hypothetical protein